MNVDELIKLVWGQDVNQEIFARWSQGFVFSQSEKSALIQFRGGPCAVIAPVQAFLLKNLITIYQLKQIRELDQDLIDKYFCWSLVEILCQSQLNNAVENQSNLSSAENEGPFRLMCLDSSCPSSKLNCVYNASFQSAKDSKIFHSTVKLRQFDTKSDLQDYIESNLPKYKADYGILLFLYSVILTRGIDKIKNEIGDTSESLINSNEGLGSQALINLLICGQATSYVWDGEKDAGGMKLVGISRRPKIGFLTHMEHLNYVQVGWYLKNPANPIWVLGSGSHLTVLFSWLDTLVTPNTDYERAKQVLSWFDADGNHFFAKEKLSEVFTKLSLCTEEDFVEFMGKELDPENVGVILFNTFLENFYDCDNVYTSPDTFAVLHYNGIEASCPENKVQYSEGIITLQDIRLQYSNDTSELLCCLKTKWGNVEGIWNNFVPSIN